MLCMPMAANTHSAQCRLGQGRHAILDRGPWKRPEGRRRLHLALLPGFNLHDDRRREQSLVVREPARAVSRPDSSHRLWNGVLR